MNPFTAIILSGGFSRRMGMEKGLVPFKGRPMIELMLELAGSLTDKVIIVANKRDYKVFGYPVYADLLPKKGPLGGIHTGLSHSSTNMNLVLACDMPMLNKQLLDHLVNNAKDLKEMLIPRHDNRLEPLCAVYHKDCVSNFEAAARADDLSMHSLIRRSDAKFIDIDVKLPFYSPYLFSNANSMKELRKLENTTP